MKPLDKLNCLNCGLKDYGYVPWQHPAEVQYPILVVGQAPGHTETLTKTPFTGAAGKMFWSLLNKAGIDKSKLYITNICQCAPPDDREPTEEEIKCCQLHLLEEIQISNPKLIVAVGEIAMRALTGQSGIQKKRGEQYLSTVEYGQVNVYCVLHPSFVMRRRQWINIAIQDLAKVPILIGTANTKVNEYRPEFIIDPIPNELAMLLSEMAKRITAIDIETPAQLDVLTALVIGIAFCASPDKAVGLNFSTPRSAFEEENWQVMKRFLEDENAKKVTQNGQFDLAVLETNGVKVKGLVYDTLLAEHTMNSDLPGDLDFLRNRYTDIKPYKPTSKEMKLIGSWTKEKRGEYNCWDVITTLAVMEGQLKHMGQRQKEVLSTIEIPLIHVCNYMERKGIKVDVPKLALINASLGPKIKSMEDKYFTPLHLNPRSPKQVTKYFKIDDSSEETITNMIRRNHPQFDLLQSLLDYRKITKIQSTYLIGVYDKLRDGRIHAHAKVGGTGTGRLSYQNPNLQNVIKELRIIYIPDSTDYYFLESDYSQLELRVIGLVAPEPAILQIFAEGKRIHDIMGKEMYGKDWDDLTPHQRLHAKAVVFGTAYGMKARSIAIRYGVTIKEAERWQNICINKYPGIGAYIKRMEQQFFSTQKCSTPFGRVRFLQTVLQAYNTPIQGTASDVAMSSIIELFKAGFDVRITVHDSIIVQVEKKNLKEQAMEIKRIMERPIKQLQNYQFPVKQEFGNNWYQLEEVK